MAILLFILLPLTVAAQETFHGYANVKAGIGNWLDDNSSIGLSFEGGLIRGENLYSFSYLRTEQILGREIINSIDLSFGRFTRKNKLVFHYQAGLGPVWSSKEAGSDENFFTVGLPFKTGIKFVPPNFFSLGLDLQANLNTEKSFYLVMLTLGVWPHQDPQ